MSEADSRGEASNSQYYAMLEAVFNDNPDAIVVVNGSGEIVSANPRTAMLFGYPPEALLGQPMEILLPERFHSQHTGHRGHFFHNPQQRAMGAGLALFGRRADNSEFPVDVMISPMHLADMTLGIAIVRDVTERKRLEQAREDSEARFRAVAETASDAMISTDSDGSIVYANAAAAFMFRFPVENMLGSSLHRLLPEQALTGSSDREVQACRNDGSHFPVEMSVADWTLGGRRYFTCIIRDITQRKTQEQSLNDALREKDTLLKEVYHRVKNNLQVIQSLLNLESRTLPEGNARAALTDTGNRVRAMALVHQKLYQSGSLASISLRDYVRDLLRQLQDSGSINPARITMKIAVSETEVGLDAAVPLGLLLNELISNSIKHGFPDDRRGTVSIHFARQGDGGVLEVSDDGIGLPPGLDPEHTPTMGLKLAWGLARQLGGRLHMESAPDQGTLCRIKLSAL
jgi:PAS domain S-box-containing protein